MDDQVVAGGIRDLVPQACAGLFFDYRSSKKAPHRMQAGRSTMLPAAPEVERFWSICPGRRADEGTRNPNNRSISTLWALLLVDAQIPCCTGGSVLTEQVTASTVGRHFALKAMAKPWGTAPA
jgi:hypothetical protein